MGLAPDFSHSSNRPAPPRVRSWNRPSLIMTSQESFDLVPQPLADALLRRGFTSLTSVQQAVLDPALHGRDLRISSQTGSGKTVAMGLVLAEDLQQLDSASHEKALPARPRVLFIAPTRELAVQICRELTWLLRPLSVGVQVVTGGTSFGAEVRALPANPAVLVATPGRLVDHLERGTVSSDQVTSVVLDEADQMLDLGFRDELEAILGKVPSGRRTHMMSATFSYAVLSLANRYQTNPQHVEGTVLGEANADIEHVAHLVRPGDRNAALVNLLLLAPDERTLVFVRTRADASEVAEHLASLGFKAHALHGDMEQPERHRTLEAFRNAKLTVLVATDVAARGLDVPDVRRVIHADPPGDAEAYTHRSGRTGRAGRKGTSVILVPPKAAPQVQRFFQLAGVTATWSPVPGPKQVRAAADDRLRASIASELAEETQKDWRTLSLAAQLLEEHDATELVAALISRIGHAGPCDATTLEPVHVEQPARKRSASASDGNGYVGFRINWGSHHGADARRLLAMVCRRGRIQGNQIGAIRIGEHNSTFEVDARVAEEFSRCVRRPDPRDPHVRIESMQQRNHGRSAGHLARAAAAARRPHCLGDRRPAVRRGAPRNS